VVEVGVVVALLVVLEVQVVVALVEAQAQGLELLARLIQVAVVAVESIQLAQQEATAAPVLSSSKSHRHTMPHSLAVSHSH